MSHHHVVSCTPLRASVHDRPLVPTIRSVISDHPTRAAVADLLHLTYRMAIAALRTGSHGANRRARSAGESQEEVALRCVAFLFEQENGRFVRLRRHYGRIAIDEWHPARLMAATRMLVQTAIDRSR